MKKKNILNRAMFRQVKSPAYGTGISANLVSNEERQRYNYGGRVGLENGTDVGFMQSPFMKQMRSIGEPLYNYGVRPLYNLARHPTNWLGEAFGYGETVDYPPLETIDITEEGEQFYPIITKEKKPKEKIEGWEDRNRPGGQHPLFGDPHDVVEDDSVTGETPIRSERHPPLDIRKEDYDRFLEGRKENTEDIDTPKPTAWEILEGELDKSAEEKKKLGRGNALMQAAAAAVEWSGAPTAEKRSAAISKGLTNVGTTAMKAAAEGMDLKNRAKILKAIEDVKGETDIKEQEMKGTQAMDRVKERIAFYESQTDKDGTKLGISDIFTGTLSDPKISNDPIASIDTLQTVAQGEDIDINTETLDMSEPKSLKKKFPAGTIIRDTKPNGKWYIVGEEGTVDHTKGYTYKAIGDWVESQASDK